MISHSQNNFNSIQAMRGVAALGVLLFHVAHMVGTYGLQTPLLYFGSFGHSGVDIFFVISGLVMALTTYDRIGETGLVKDFLKKRAIRIYSNYWLIAGILSAISLLGFATINSNASWLESIFLMPLSGKEHIISVAWTLSFEMCFYFLFAIFIGFKSLKKLKISLIIWALIIIIANIFIEREKGVTPFYIAFFFSPFHLEFIMGCFVGFLFKKPSTINYQPSTFIIIGLITYIPTILLTLNSPLSGWENTYARVLTYGIGSALILYGLINLESKGLKTPKFLNILGDSSYTLYLVHMPILYLIAHFMPYSENWSDLAKYSYLFALIATPTLYSIAHYRLLERPLLKLLKKRFCC